MRLSIECTNLHHDDEMLLKVKVVQQLDDAAFIHAAIFPEVLEDLDFVETLVKVVLVVPNDL